MAEEKNSTSSPIMEENISSFFDEIVLISEKKDSVPADVNSVDTAIIPFSAPEQALYYILAQKEKNISYSALILCDYTVNDFDAALLISLLRLHPLGLLFPVGVIFDSPKTDADNTFIDKEKQNLKVLGASFFLVRPFSFQTVAHSAREVFIQNKNSIDKYYQNLQALENAPEQKRSLFLTNWEQKLNSFEKAFMRFFYVPDNNANFEELFTTGEQKYDDRLFRQATNCFERSTNYETPRKSDSFAYLYIIEKEQGHPEKGKVYLERALELYIENEEWEKVTHYAEIFAEDFPKEQNPLLSALQRNFVQTNYGAVNKILETAKSVLPAKEIADFMVQMNGSKKFPPAIANYLDTHKDLQQVIFTSGMKNIVLDGEEYRREQERIRAITYLEKQRLARLRGEKAPSPFISKPASSAKTAGTAGAAGKKNAAAADNAQKNTAQSQKELLTSLSLTPPSQEKKESLQDVHSKYNPATNFLEKEAVKKNEENRENGENPQKENSQENAKESAAKNPSNTANNNQQPNLHHVEDMPTVMLDATGSLLGDMINMVKYTRKLYKKK